ncbi:MAG: zinc ribbon domain-containing protein [Haloplanus sp.]
MTHGERSDPRCPECGGPIGATATYCMHCSADLTEERAAADADGDGVWDADASDASDVGRSDDASSARRSSDDGLLDPDGLLDGALTTVVGLVGGLVVGVVGTVVLLVLTDSDWGAWLGVAAWLCSTVYLARLRTVFDALSKTAYGVSIVLLLVPLVAFTPSQSSDVGVRIVIFATVLGLVAIPAALAALVGVLVARYAPDAES